jgi:hypothetical protein
MYDLPCSHNASKTTIAAPGKRRGTRIRESRMKRLYCTRGRARPVALLDDSSEECARVDVQRIGEFAEFQHIELSLTTFELSNKGMGAAQAPGKFSLSDTRLLSRLSECSHECFVAGAPKLLSHAAPETGAVHITSVMPAPIEGTALGSRNGPYAAKGG